MMRYGGSLVGFFPAGVAGKVEPGGNSGLSFPASQQGMVEVSGWILGFSLPALSCRGRMAFCGLGSPLPPFPGAGGHCSVLSHTISMAGAGHSQTLST